MPGVKLVVSDPDAKRAYQMELSEDKARSILGRKIGETANGDALGLKGYEILITGGSDKDGFPMREDLHGEGRKKILLASSPGYHPKEKGVRRRKMIRGSTLTREIVQVNAKSYEKGRKNVRRDNR